MIAKAARKIFSELGTRLPSSEMTPSTKAISVAVDRPPTNGGWIEPIHGHVDQGGDRHAACCGGTRQDPPAPGRQLAIQHLALDLQPDEQKEDRHRASLIQCRRLRGPT